MVASGVRLGMRLLREQFSLEPRILAGVSEAGYTRPMPKM